MRPSTDDNTGVSHSADPARLRFFQALVFTSILAVVVLISGASGAADSVYLWHEGAPTHASSYHATSHHSVPHHMAPVAAQTELNGHLQIGGLAGGVGNTFGAFCCTSSGFVVVGGDTRRGFGTRGSGNVAFRQARDATFGISIGGPAIDRGFRFRANSIQRSR